MSDIVTTILSISDEVMVCAIPSILKITPTGLVGKPAPFKVTWCWLMPLLKATVYDVSYGKSSSYSHVKSHELASLHTASSEVFKNTIKVSVCEVDAGLLG